MEIETLPPMKPVLVEHVSDDINVLQKDDVTKQKTVLTARAIEDIFKCAPINENNATDAAYFVTDTGRRVVDLNKIVTAGSRTLLEDQYVHGPDQLFVDVVSGNRTWAVNHTKKSVVPHAFLYTFSVLDTGALSWRNYDHVISIDDQLDRSVDTRKFSEQIRQVIVPNLLNEYLSFDGTKEASDTYLRNHRTRYDIGVPWTRVGRPYYSGVTANEVNSHPENQYYIKNLTTNEYKPLVLGSTVSATDACYKLVRVEWEDWYMQSKTHNGPEYFFNIELTDAGFSVVEPITDSVYHVYNNGSMVLPNANKDGYKVGQKIIVEAHPPLSSSATSCCVVTYQDTTATGTSFGEEMRVEIKPRTRRNIKDVYGNVRSDALLTSVACFEIVEQKDSNGSVFRTWELDGGVEETDFTSGIAQMLGEHTDSCTGDLVKYDSYLIQNKKKLTINYPVTSAGFVVARFLKKNNGASEFVDGSWKATVNVIQIHSDACFSAVSNTGTPDANEIYYVKHNGVYALTENNGHPSSFNSTEEYYKLVTTNADSIPVIKVAQGTGNPREYLILSDLTANRMRGFSAYANRGDIISIEIESNNLISTLSNNVFPIVMFMPDPHDTYIHKAAINPSAFTYKQLSKLFLDGTVVDDIRLVTDTDLLESIMNSPVSTRALTEAYAYLALKLQNKGLLFANSERLNLTGTELDTLVDSGFYYCVPVTGAMSGYNTFPPNMLSTGCNIIVATNAHAPKDLVHEEEGTITSATKATQIAIVTGNPVTMEDPMFDVAVRVGAKQNNGTWVWSNWQSINDWDTIRDKPKYYHARWDYLEDPNGFLNHVNAGSSSQSGSITVGSTTISNLSVYKIPTTTIEAVLNTVNDVDEYTHTETGTKRTYGSDASARDYEYSNVTEFNGTKPVNYKIPQFLVGLRNPTANGNNKNYVVDIELPQAVTTKISQDYPARRRKVRFLLTGSEASIGGKGWAGLYLYVHYKSSDGSTVYQYIRNWGADFTTNESMLDIEFEQADMPTGDRLWCPIEIG